MRIAMTGSGYMATLMTKAILNSSHELVAVIDNGRTVKGRRRWLRPLLAAICTPNSQVCAIARRRRIPIIYIDRMDDSELEPLRALRPDLILVGGFSIILKPSIIDLPTIGCVNCHSSLLPKHRGPNPFQAVILAGESETGVTFHVIDPGIDTGPILEQHAIPVRGTDTAGTLVRRTSQLAAEKLPALLDRIEREGLNGIPQNSSLATYDKKLQGDALYLDWNKSAVELDRIVRGCFPFSIARFRYRGQTIYVSRGKPEPEESGRPPGEVVAIRPFTKIATGSGTFVLMVGYTLRPVPWFWPGLVWRPPLGSRIE
ncbi:MAG: methionyl-tRNA formyltransferase [Candidatus Hydrogenedentota bacterium]